MEKFSIDLNRGTSSTSVSETQPEHSVERLENVILHNEDESRHKCKVKWSKEVTILLISGWLNTSKDAIVGNDQTSTHFWARIAEYYNTNQKGEQARIGRQCKDHWNKMNQKVERFNGCYKRVQQAHHSGWSDEQILENAHQLYKYENNNSNFLLVDCLRLPKDEPKWNTMYQPKGGKRTKVPDTGAFTSSSNADISDDEVHEVRPTSQKATKRKGKEKKDTHARFIEISEQKASALEKEATIKEKEAEDNRMTKYMDYLIMDTSHMTPEQKKDHENLCTYIKNNILKL
ncbi:glutathione S-transferase T3-like [Humulus lupulus]|uniref:glutathione S-transferase T3-like n=1 Tax=Humulus lupulus TaxID=3486 RepID=UPI002B41159E|nr:glutathione S-transferase T3-like [Humulus lupulus]